MIVWEWTIPPQYMHVQLTDDTTPVPDFFLDEAKSVNFTFNIRSSNTPCVVYFDKTFYDEFIAEVEHFPRIEDEWIKDFGPGKPTVLVVVYVDMPDRLMDEAKAIADKYFTYRFLTSEEGFDYL